MQDKYQLTTKQALALAKLDLVPAIYSLAKIEGLNVTFRETYAIIEKAKMKQVDIAVVSTADQEVNDLG